MRAYTLNELMILTRTELFALHQRIVYALRQLPEGSAEHRTALANLRISGGCWRTATQRRVRPINALDFRLNQRFTSKGRCGKFLFRSKGDHGRVNFD